MKILIINWRDSRNPLAGGAEIVTHEYAKAWVKAGHKVTLLTSSFKGANKQEIIDGVNIIRRGNNLLIHLMLFHVLVIWVYFRRFRGKVDLVIDQIHGIPFFTPLYVREKKVAFICEVAKELWDHLYPFPINHLGKLVEKFYFRLYRSVPFITISNSTKADLLKMGVSENNIRLIEVGISCKPVQNLEEKIYPPKLLFVNRLTPAKGIEEAINAFAYINKMRPDVEFWVVGRSSKHYMKRLQRLVEKLGLNEKVIFFGFISEQKKWELFRKAHVFVNSSVREGWGLVVTEANALGTPAVVYNSPGLKDSTKHLETGLVCEKNTPQELAKSIVRLLDDKVLYEKLRKNAWEWGKEFTWDKIASGSVRLLDKISF